MKTTADLAIVVLPADPIRWCRRGEWVNRMTPLAVRFFELLIGIEEREIDLPGPDSLTSSIYGCSVETIRCQAVDLGMLEISPRVYQGQPQTKGTP